MTRPRFLRLSSVSDRTGLSKTTIYKKICDGSFPAQIRLSERAVGWGSIPVRSAIHFAKWLIKLRKFPTDNLGLTG